MAEQLQLRRGSDLENDAFTGAQGELTYDTTKGTVRVHNGSTQGGAMIDPIVEFQLPTVANNHTWYRKYASGWVEQGGITGAINGSDATASVTLPVEMSDADYAVQITIVRTATAYRDQFLVATARTATGFTVFSNWAGSTNGGTNNYGQWEVKGVAA